MTQRLCKAWHITSPRINDDNGHYSTDVRQAKCWMPQATFDYINAQKDIVKALLMLLKSPKSNPDLFVSIEKETFFNDSEHWYISINYHVTEEV